MTRDQELWAYLNARRAALGDAFQVETACAEYLDRLALGLTTADLDSGFVLPITFAQFVRSNREHWPGNVQV